MIFKEYFNKIQNIYFVSFHRIGDDVGHFHALQPKTKKREINNNNDINLLLSSSSSSSIPIEFNIYDENSIIPYNNNLLSITPFEENSDNNIYELHPNRIEQDTNINTSQYLSSLLSFNPNTKNINIFPFFKILLF
jgi:hypothetical protein